MNLIIICYQSLCYLIKTTNRKYLQEKSDARLRLVNEILQGMRLIKLRAWENVFEDRIRRTRNHELKLLNKDSVYWALISNSFYIKLSIKKCKKRCRQFVFLYNFYTCFYNLIAI